MNDVKVAHLEGAAAMTAKIPTQFSYEDWTDWQQSVVTYFKATKGIVPEIPLYYDICAEPCPIPLNKITPMGKIIYNAPHQGHTFDRDNREVHRVIDESTLGTDVAD